MTATKTPEQIRTELNRKGVSIAQWAVANKVNAFLVYQLLAGRSKGLRGEAHRAAVLLGLKDGEIVEPQDVQRTLAA